MKTIEVSEKEKEQIERSRPAKVNADDFFKTHISNTMTTLSFRLLMDDLNKGRLRLLRYQRKYVWDRNSINQLVISLIRRVPIPPIYIYPSENKQHLILDGQQRCLSLFLYWCGLIPREFSVLDFYEIMQHMESGRTLREILLEDYTGPNKPFERIEDSEYSYNANGVDLVFDNLTGEQRDSVNKSKINICTVAVENKEDKASVYTEVFKLLNKTSCPLTAQEIRNGAYVCKFYDMLYELTIDLKAFDVWQNLCDKVDSIESMERLLRLCTLDYYTQLKQDSITFKSEKGECIYKASISELLDKYSLESLKFEKEYIRSVREKVCIFFNELNELKAKLKDKFEDKITQSLIEALLVVYIKTDDLAVLEQAFLVYLDSQCHRMSSVLGKRINKRDPRCIINILSDERPRLEDKFTFVYRCYKEYKGGK